MVAVTGVHVALVIAWCLLIVNMRMMIAGVTLITLIVMFVMLVTMLVVLAKMLIALVGMAVVAMTSHNLTTKLLVIVTRVACLGSARKR